MRLTLRTLLAYMDGLLDPKDSQEIGKKIEDSKFATELFHKIRDVMRRLRLGAPSITERGANLDCNTVAEYLDNALPGDRVPDFEEVSLKSEIHLAEVASCHQILTMVLGEPAEIDPESRQRMYQLPTVANRVDEERLAAVEAASMLSGDGNASAHAPLIKVRPRPVVPEYLRNPPKKSRLLPAAAVMLLVGAALGLLLLVLGQFNAGTPLGNALLWAQAKLHGKADEEEDRDLQKPAKDLKESDTALKRDAAPKSSSSVPLAAASESVVPAPRDAGSSPASTEKREALLPAVDKRLEKPVPGKPLLPGFGKSAEAAAGPSLPREPKPGGGENPLARPAAGPRSKPAEPQPLPSGPTDGSLPARLPGPSDMSKPGATPPAFEDTTKIGRFMSDGQDVLLTFEAGNARWRRVLPEEFLGGGQPLLALPSYRSRVVVLNVGATLELINGTRIELLPDNAQGQPGVEIDFGARGYQAAGPGRRPPAGGGRIAYGNHHAGECGIDGRTGSDCASTIPARIRKRPSPTR